MKTVYISTYIKTGRNFFKRFFGKNIIKERYNL